MLSDAPMNEWKALVGRISLFTAAPWSAAPSALDLYRNIWETEPDNFFKQPNPLMPSVAQGGIGNLTASCVIQQSRIDFNFQPAPQLICLLPPSRTRSNFVQACCG